MSSEVLSPDLPMRDMSTDSDERSAIPIAGTETTTTIPRIVTDQILANSVVYEKL